MMKVFVYRKCSTCMKALKWLEAHNVEFEERAIKGKLREQSQQDLRGKT